jgi:hypothetical protein
MKKSKPPKRGQPPIMVNGKRRQVYLDDATWDAAAKLGQGNVSRGLRLAVGKHRPR